MISPLLILLASLIGSPHCAAMCGGFSAMACSSSRPRSGQLLYHCGRMTAYLALGAIAGFLGSRLNFGGDHFGVHQIASLFSGVLLVCWGGASLFSSVRKRPLFGLSAKISGLAYITAKLKKGSTLAPFLLGASSAFLPCGWLYTYVAVAAGTGSAIIGLVVMFFFWLGTLPILVTIGGLSRIVSSPLKKYAPTLTSLLILLAGCFSLYDHVRLLQSNGDAVSCHDTADHSPP